MTPLSREHVTQTATGAVRTTATGEEGAYTLPSLAVGPTCLKSPESFSAASMTRSTDNYEIGRFEIYFEPPVKGWAPSGFR